MIKSEGLKVDKN